MQQLTTKLPGALSTAMITAIIVTAIAAPALAQTKVYITRDADGNPVFSDRKSSGAEAHVVQELPSMPAFNVPDPARQPETQNREPVPVSYTSLSIISPSNGTDLPRGMAGDIQVSGVLTPALQGDDEVILKDSGKEIARSKQTTFTLTNLDRGEHNLQMEVVSPDGEVRISSQNITLYVQRSSSLAR